jgi:orotate phosphoribosyltransferase
MVESSNSAALNSNLNASPPTSSTLANSTVQICYVHFPLLTQRQLSKPILPLLLSSTSFSPTYKGIPIATATVDKLAGLDPEKYGKVCYSFDRKEAKDHGEGGNIVGAPLKGKRVFIEDDVVSAGTAKREAIEKTRKEGGLVVSIVVALDRMEKLPAPNRDDDTPMPSAIREIRKEYGIPVLSILTLNDIIRGLKRNISDEDIRRMEQYRAKYKASD